MAIVDVQTSLKGLLQDEPQSGKLENLAAALIGRLIGVTIAIAKTGFQYGGDAGPAGRQGRRFRIECKKYSDTTALSDRELLGEIDHALLRDPALEAWILVATRSVSEQLEQDLLHKGESIGVPVVVLDWKNEGLPSLAALCASAPDLVEKYFSPEAATLARQLTAASGEAIERLQKDLQSWQLGFDSLRSQSLGKLNRIWLSPRESTASLGQNAAGGAITHKIRRSTVYDVLNAWWDGPAKDDAPAVVVGWDGVGKTWATINWLVDRHEDLPIALVVPSSATAEINVSETGVKEFIANRLYDIVSGVRDRDHWLRRLEHLLKRPPSEGPVLVVFFDGMNQESSVSWLHLLKILQGETFANRIRVIVSTRTHHYETRLGHLRGLVSPAVKVQVDLYDKAPGGELDQMLAYEGLTQADLHPDLVELARTPRLFRLVVQFRERLVDAGQVTVHRLLWEYGRDSFGIRAGKSFSEDEWRTWLQEIARQYRDGVREYSLKDIGNTVSRPDLADREVYARLSDIIDGRFAIPGPSGALQLQSSIVTHALGAALLAHLDTVTSPTFNAIESELISWLDPIAGLDQRAEILRAAVSILVERGQATTPLTGVLVTGWLQTQNVTDAHRLELANLAVILCESLLDAIENSVEYTHASARFWAVNALRSITRPNSDALFSIVNRSRRWLSVISRGVRKVANQEHEKYRAEHFKSRVGVDASGALRVLGVDLRFVDYDNGALGNIVPLILEGFPLAEATPAFEAAAISMGVCNRFGNDTAWDGLKWLCLLNEVNSAEATAALRLLSADVAKRTPEVNINAALPGRIAALLLCLTGEEADETEANAIDSGLDRQFTYDKDYLSQPSRSYFRLERRHANEALEDVTIALRARIQRLNDLWLDPMFDPPCSVFGEIQDHLTQFELEKLHSQSSWTREDHFFEDLKPAFARYAPELLADTIRRKVQAFHSCPLESRYWNAIRAREYLLLSGEAEGDAARVLRLSKGDTTGNDEAYAQNQLLMLEFHNRGYFDQVRGAVEAGLEHIYTDFCEILCKVAAGEADALIALYGDGSNSNQRDLLCLFAHGGIPFSETAWSWICGKAFGGDSDVEGPAFFALARMDESQLGRELLSRGWSWSSSKDLWVNHYGSGALIAVTAGLPFEQVAPHIAPWRLVEAARRRGADSTDIALAAKILDCILSAERLEAPDPGAILYADRTDHVAGTLRLSITCRESEEDLADALRAMMDTDARTKALNRAAETAAKRIQDARATGANLYLMNVSAEDMEAVVLYAPEFIDKWLEGANDLTNDFKRRVNLAETVYLSICEALLKHHSERGRDLWRSLKNALHTRINGSAEIDEMIHIVFRAPDVPVVEALREELLDITRCNRDRQLLDVAISATSCGKTAWLSNVIDRDKQSDLAWRRKRGVVLSGFQSNNTLPVEGAWPEGEFLMGHKELLRRSAHFRYREACARHWWRLYLSTTDINQAYAAWVLFLRSADRRVWVWLNAEVKAADDLTDLFRFKMSYAEINLSALKKAIERNEEKLDKEFLGRKIGKSVAPWV